MASNHLVSMFARSTYVDLFLKDVTQITYGKHGSAIIEEYKLNKNMTNFELLSGPFAGEIVSAHDKILDVPFDDLDSDLQQRVVEWAHRSNKDSLSLEDQVSAWEQSWDCIQTEKNATLHPISGNFDRIHDDGLMDEWIDRSSWDRSGIKPQGSGTKSRGW